jgi:hypothetical protein
VQHVLLSQYNPKHFAVHQFLKYVLLPFSFSKPSKNRCRIVNSFVLKIRPEMAEKGKIKLLLNFNQLSVEPSKMRILLGFFVLHFERVFVCCALNNKVRKDSFILLYIAAYLPISISGCPTNSSETKVM